MKSIRLDLLSLAFWICLAGATAGSLKCPPLPYSSLPNGDIIQNGRSLQFQCEKGYILSGEPRIRCFKGNWTSEVIPQCHAAGYCNPLPAIQNGDIMGFGDEIHVGYAVQYICHSGYMIIGSSTRTCLDSGFWSGISPSCISETLSAKDVADKLENEFVTKMGSHTNNSRFQVAKSLDKSSLLKGLEIVILVDRSSSIDPFDLNIAKKFIKFLFKEFDIRNGNNPLGSRVTVIAFGTNVDILLALNDSNIFSAEEASVALDELLQPNGGGTAMVPALTSVFLKVLPLLRPEAKRALFLISDGEPNVGDETITPWDIAKQLKEAIDFEIFALGVGPDINRQTLASVSSEPLSSHVFLLNSFTDLENVLDLMKNHTSEEPDIIRPDKCGIMETDNSTGSWPWMAAVYVSQETVNSTLMNVCTGVLICSQWILTAASCFFHVNNRDVSMSLKEAFVVLGENDLLKDEENQRNFYAADVITHPNYNPFTEMADNLALLKLHKPAPSSPFRPVCLPPTDSTVPLHLDYNINASLGGWGWSAPDSAFVRLSSNYFMLQMSIQPVTLVEVKECWGTVNGNISANTFFCAEPSVVGHCIGLPGSPVVAQEPRKKFNHVLGLLSERSICRNDYNRYSELTKYITWINRVTSQCHLAHWK